MQPSATISRQFANPSQPACGNLKRAHAKAGFIPDSASNCSKPNRLIIKSCMADLNSKFQRKEMVSEFVVEMDLAAKEIFIEMRIVFS